METSYLKTRPFGSHYPKWKPISPSDCGQDSNPCTLGSFGSTVPQGKGKLELIDILMFTFVILFKHYMNIHHHILTKHSFMMLHHTATTTTTQGTHSRNCVCVSPWQRRWQLAMLWAKRKMTQIQAGKDHLLKHIARFILLLLADTGITAPTWPPCCGLPREAGPVLTEILKYVAFS